ncbi:MAG: hypothetical protein JXR30_03160 [Alphaproteobacteria bacterium]|nr:hypothetical protein [Alphaproteobacteria bacterium]
MKKLIFAIFMIANVWANAQTTDHVNEIRDSLLQEKENVLNKEIVTDGGIFILGASTGFFLESLIYKDERALGTWGVMMGSWTVIGTSSLIKAFIKKKKIHQIDKELYLLDLE